MKYFIKCCMIRENWVRAIKVALVVGTILALINHYDMFIYGLYTNKRIIQIIAAYFVPFVVSLYGNAMVCRIIDLGIIKK